MTEDEKIALAKKLDRLNKEDWGVTWRFCVFLLSIFAAFMAGMFALSVSDYQGNVEPVSVERLP